MPRRLGKALREATGRPRRALTRAWHEGRISVWRDGSPWSPPSLAALIFDEDRLAYEGQALPSLRALDEGAASLDGGLGCWMLHKPRGVITTTRDPGQRPDLAPWMAQLPEEAFPVGRLDRDTSGLLLLTEDGDLAYMLLKPTFHVPKEYHLTLDEPPEQVAWKLEALRQGVTLEDGPARALSARVTATLTCSPHRAPLTARARRQALTQDLTQGLTQELPSSARVQTCARLVIDEGRNRQVRRMCRAVGLRLIHLHRLAVGPLRLGALQAGQLHALSPEQIGALWEAVGGQALPTLRAIEALAQLQLSQPEARLQAWLERQDVRALRAWARACPEVAQAILTRH